jgi:hypothetical protein
LQRHPCLFRIGGDQQHCKCHTLTERYKPQSHKTHGIHQHRPWGFPWAGILLGMRECHGIQLQWEYATGADRAHKAQIGEPVHAFNPEPFIIFNTKGSFL